MRVTVLQRLIEILRASGYPGYDEKGINSSSRVSERLNERYIKKYGYATFTPEAVKEVVHVHKANKDSIVQDKVATPSEAPKYISEWDKTLRPHHIMAERSTRSQANIHENYKAVFSRFGKFNIQTGTEMTPQFFPWYLGMAFPFTLPSAVGGYDVPGCARWRRPEDDALPEDPRSTLDEWMTSISNTGKDDFQPQHMAMGPACKVKLFDLTRGLPQRIEGQYRRH